MKFEHFSNCLNYIIFQNLIHQNNIYLTSNEKSNKLRTKNQRNSTYFYPLNEAHEPLNESIPEGAKISMLNIHLCNFTYMLKSVLFCITHDSPKKQH